MKRTLLLLLFILPFFINAQDCSHAHVHGCNIVWPNIYGNLAEEDDDFGVYSCISDWDYIGMPDAMHIINAVGSGLDFDQITITLKDIPPGSDFDLIVVDGCGEVCTSLSDNPTSTSVDNTDESVTVTFSHSTTLYIIVEGYMLDGGSTYTLQIGEADCPYSVSNGCINQPAVDCSNGNSFSGSLDYFPFWPTPPQQDAYWCNGFAEYGYSVHEDLYYVEPNSFGNIQASLSSNGDARLFVYQCNIPLLDVSPYCILSGHNLTIPIESGFGNVPSGYIIAVDASSPCDYTLTLDFPGCQAPSYDPCGDCFPYAERPGNKCYVDMSNVPCQSGSFSYSSINGGSATPTSLNGNSEISFPHPGEYLLCYAYNCQVDDPTDTESKAESGECCIVVSIGQNCQEAPIAHFEIDPEIESTNNGHQSFFDASSSENAEWYNWDWGDGQSSVSTSSAGAHDYSVDYIYTTACLTTTNNCGMSRYCCSFNTYGDGDFAWSECSLPFDPYAPPKIVPFVSGNNLQISDISSFACSAESIIFNPGDGTGSYPISCSGVNYNYPDDGKSYVACIIIDFGCYRICFYYTYRPPGFKCEDSYELYCNQYGNDYHTDANIDNWSDRVTDLIDYHECFGTNDGWDNNNTLGGNPVFGRNEVIYQFTNPSSNHNGSITVDLIPLENGLDLDLFVYEECYGSAQLQNCIASSTHDNNPNGERDALIINNVPGNQTYYIVVDGQSNAGTANEGEFDISITCGELCEKTPIPINCGETYNGTTVESTNYASYYCNCPGTQGLGPAGNYGPENIHQFTLTDPATVNITLEIESNNRDLELYLLSSCATNSCIAKSRNPGNQDEAIQITLQAGTYYVVVEGFLGDAGHYNLTLDNCNNEPVPMNNCEEIFTYDFENYQDGDIIPTDDNTGRWSYGQTYNDDPNDNSLDATIENDGNDNGLVFNAGNYYYANARLNLGNSYSGTYKVEWDMKLQYVNGELYGGQVLFYDYSGILDFSEALEIEFGHNSNGNYADLNKITAGLNGVNSNKLTEIDVIQDYNGNNPIVEYNLAIVYEPQKNKFTLYVNDDEIYTGTLNFSNNQGISTRYIEFANDDDQDYMVIDDISFSECTKCSDNYNIDCDLLSHRSIQVYENNQVGVELELNGMSSEDIDEYMLIDETTEDTISLDGLYYDNCTPGHTYRFCIVYIDEEGCPQICCFRIAIPLDCYYFRPYYSGDAEQIQYTYESNNVPSNYEIEQWYIDGSNAGINSTIVENYDSNVQKSICFLLYDPVLHTYILCCRRICVSNPYACNQINYEQNGDDYMFTLADDIDTNTDVQWSINDTPVNATGTEYQTNLTEYGGSVVRICCYYRDFLGCWRVCYREIEVMPDPDAVIFKIDNVCGAPDEVIDVPVRVVNFDDITSLGFSIRIANTNVAELVDIVPASQWPSLLSAAVYDNRRGGINWFSGSGSPYSAADESIMAILKVKLKGNLNQNTIISITADPIPITAEHATNTITPQVVSGSVCIEQNLASLCGEILREDGVPIKDVMVQLSGATTAETMTDANGSYCFNDLNLGTYTVSPLKDINHKNGVTPGDLFFIRRHTLGLELFVSPYKYIAADVDYSLSVTPGDLFKLNRLTLNLDQEFANNYSWRFVPSGYQFPLGGNPLNPAYPETTTINLNTNVTGIDFIGSKIGDVNLSNDPQNARAEEGDDSREGIAMRIDSTELPMGEEAMIPVKVSGFEGVIANGFSLQWDPSILEGVRLTGANGYELGESNFNLESIEEGKLGVVWYSTTGQPLTIEEDGTIFYIVAKAIADQGSEINISMSDEPVSITAETLDGIINTTWTTSSITVTHPSGTNDLTGIMENINVWPNPMLDIATLEVYSYKNTEAKISVKSNLGQEIYSLSKEFNIGKNTVVIDLKSQDISSGIYLLQIETPNGIEVIKLYKK